MSEIREGLPYIKKMKFTSRTLTTIERRQLANGQEVGVPNPEYPGLIVEVVHYLAPDTPSPAEILRFPSKAFYEEQLAIMQAIENKSPEDLGVIEQVQLILNNTSTVWLEEVVAAAGVASIEDAFAQAYSDSLDYFDSLKEPVAAIGGRKTYLGMIQWEASIPFEEGQKKSLSIRVGIYLDEAQKTTPVVKELFFEDGLTKRERELNIANLNTGIANFQAEKTALLRIKTLKETEPKTPEILAELEQANPTFLAVQNIDERVTQLDNEIRFREIERDRLSALKLGDLATFIQKPSMQTSIPGIGLAVFGLMKVKNPDWADLNMALVQERFAYPSMA